MNILKRIYHFLGGINCAISLLATTAILVIVGTFIESHTDSHRIAANYIYSSPLFALLLWGFFLNILISACRRWPFKVKHIPFLITHLGLLMILGGCLIKNYYGVQGYMTLVEGSGSHQLVIPDSYSVVLEKRDETDPKKVVTEEYTLSRALFDKRYKLTSIGSHPISDLSLKIVDYSEHSKESWKSWFKGDFAYIQGLPPLPIHKIDNHPPIASGQFKLNYLDEALWNIYTLRGGASTATLRSLLIEGTEIILTNKNSNTLLARVPLKTLIEGESLIGNIIVSATLSDDILNSSAKGSTEIQFNIANVNNIYSQTIALPLNGENALVNHYNPYTVPGIVPIKIEMNRMPTLVLLEDQEGELTFMAVNSHGQLHIDTFPEGRLRSIIVYDEGFGGYSAQTKIPFTAHSPSPGLAEEVKLHQLAHNLRHFDLMENELSPPLELLKRACKKTGTDFVESFLNFLIAWDSSHKWLANGLMVFPEPLMRTLENLDWSSTAPEICQSCLWSTRIIPDLEIQMAGGVDLLMALKEIRWPLIDRLQEVRQQTGKVTSAEIEMLFQTLTQQISYIAGQWPNVHSSYTPSAATHATMLSAYCRLYEIDLQSLLPTLNAEEKEAALKELKNNEALATEVKEIFPPLQHMHLQQKIDFLKNLPESHQLLTQLYELTHKYDTKETPSREALNEHLVAHLPIRTLATYASELHRSEHDITHTPICLECSITPLVESLETNTKPEDNLPKITLYATKKGAKQLISLSYDRHGTGLKWPLLHGEYRARFQPHFLEIPYHLRLRNATKKNYANTQRPQSYQCSLLVTDRASGKSEYKEISMNNVYESPEGYRFYLSNISPSDESQVKKIQLVVNYDPAKYLLTYPGGLIVALGIGLLFWMRPYRK